MRRREFIFSRRADRKDQETWDKYHAEGGEEEKAENLEMLARFGEYSKPEAGAASTPSCPKHGSQYIRTVEPLNPQDNSSPTFWVGDGYLCTKCQQDYLAAAPTRQPTPRCPTCHGGSLIISGETVYCKCGAQFLCRHVADYLRFFPAAELPGVEGK